jgi:8-oxo-dGTP diphosphatase
VETFADRIRSIFRRLASPFFLTEVDGFDADTSFNRGEHRPDVGVSAIILRDNEVLLGLRRGSHAAGVWATPGGHLEFKESFFECVRREVAEETGLSVLGIQKHGFLNNILEEDDKHYVTLYFTCRVGPGEPVLLEPHKCDIWQWFSLDDLPDNLWPGMKAIFADLRV